jgi:hypothetical protein
MGPPDHQQVVVLGLGEQDLRGVAPLLHFGLGRNPGLLGDRDRLVERFLQPLLGVVGPRFEAGVDGDEAEPGLRRRKRDRLAGSLGAVGVAFDPAEDAFELGGRLDLPVEVRSP